MKKRTVVTLVAALSTLAAVAIVVWAVRAQGPLASLSPPASPVARTTATPAESDSQASANQQVATLSEETPLQSSKVVEVDVRQIRQLLPKDAIAPIYDPEFSSAQDADIDPKELVIGVELNGESRAYPIGPLVYREMVNDSVGGIPILVTW